MLNHTPETYGWYCLKSKLSPISKWRPHIKNKKLCYVYILNICNKRVWEGLLSLLLIIDLKLQKNSNKIPTFSYFEHPKIPTLGWKFLLFPTFLTSPTTFNPATVIKCKGVKSCIENDTLIPAMSVSDSVSVNVRHRDHTLVINPVFKVCWVK